MSAMPVLVFANLSDERLAQLARDGDERAFEAIVARYRTQLLAHARTIAGADAAEDALQHALASAWHSLHRRRAVRHVRAWLFKIVHRAALQTLRERHGATRELADADLRTISLEEEFERSTRVRDVLAAVAALPLHEREALVATSLSGRSTGDLAREYGIAEGALRQLVFRARTRARAAAVAAFTPPALLTRMRGLLEPLGRRAHTLTESVSGALPTLVAPAAVGSALVLAAAGIQAASGSSLPGGQHPAAGQRAGASTARTHGPSTPSPGGMSRNAPRNPGTPGLRHLTARDLPAPGSTAAPVPGSAAAQVAGTGIVNSSTPAPMAKIPANVPNTPLPPPTPSLPQTPPALGPLTGAPEAVSGAVAPLTETVGTVTRGTNLPQAVEQTAAPVLEHAAPAVEGVIGAVLGRAH